MSEFKHIEGTGKPLKVVSPITIIQDDFVLTKDKEYKVTGYWKGFSKRMYGFGFFIEDDFGNVLNCLERICGYLDNGNWIVTERES